MLGSGNVSNIVDLNKAFDVSPDLIEAALPCEQDSSSLSLSKQSL